MISDSALIHSHALIESDVCIGDHTRIWAFSHILPGVRIGADCNICDHTFIESGVTLGDRVTIKSGVYLWSGTQLESDVFIGPCVAFTNDKFPRSRQHLSEYPLLLIKQGASIGANATILPGITIGRYAMIGAGSVVTKSVPDFALFYGNPAALKHWICPCGKKLDLDVEIQLTECVCGRVFRLKNEICQLVSG